MPTVEVPIGPAEYRVFGPDARSEDAIVARFVRGVGVRRSARWWHF